MCVEYVGGDGRKTHGGKVWEFSRGTGGGRGGGCDGCRRRGLRCGKVAGCLDRSLEGENVSRVLQCVETSYHETCAKTPELVHSIEDY